MRSHLSQPGMRRGLFVWRRRSRSIEAISATIIFRILPLRQFSFDRLPKLARIGDFLNERRGTGCGRERRRFTATGFSIACTSRHGGCAFGVEEGDLVFGADGVCGGDLAEGVEDRGGAGHVGQIILLLVRVLRMGMYVCMVYYLSTSLIGVTKYSPSGPVRCLKIEGTLKRWWESWWLLSPNETSDRFILLAFSLYNMREVDV